MNKIIFIVLLLFSCNSNPIIKKDKTFFEGSTFWIYSNINKKESYICYSFESDLIYISYSDNSKQITKSLKAKKYKPLANKIKDIVFSHINCKRFLKHKPKDYKSGEVTFLLSRYDIGNKICAKYFNLEKEKDVSNEYNDFIKYLRKSKFINERW
jgi:hypothetical protein